MNKVIDDVTVEKARDMIQAMKIQKMCSGLPEVEDMIQDVKFSLVALENTWKMRGRN